MELKVYNQDNQAKATFSASDSSTHQKAIQEDNVLSLSCVHYTCISLDVNDYVDFSGERFWMTEKYVPRLKSSVEWAYDCKFYGIESLIKRALVLKTVDGENEVSFSLTASARMHLALVVENINRVLGTTDWKAGECTLTENLIIDYNGTFCDEALKKVAEAAKTEWWVDGMTINITRCEHGEEIRLSYGNGLVNLEKGTASNVKFFTRLFPIGSTRNIDSSIYKHTRLQLPDGQKYVEQNLQYGIIEHSEEAAFADIYPKRIGTVGTVSHEERKGDDGEPYTVYYFTDPELNFDPNDYEIGGLVKQVTFQEGSELAGRDFEVNFDSKTHKFEIITQYPYSDGTQLPGGLLIPKSGDKYILWNLRMPDEYYPIAEKEFAIAVSSYMEEYKLDKSVYKGATDYIDLDERKITLSIGQRIRMESWQFFPEVGYRSSRITKITRKVNNPSKADIEISDVLSKGSMSKIEDSIEEVRNYTQVAASAMPDIVRSWENTPASDYNLYSSKKSEREFISKRRKDIAQKLIGFLEGIYTGDFVSGLIGGSGARIDEKGYAEMTGLVLREFLEVPELRFNRVDVISGELWNSFVFGIIESVDVKNQIAKVKLEDGELNGLHINDFLRGIFHNIEGGNVTTDEIDGCGFSKLPGFTTAYFTPVELLPDGKSFKYALKPGTTAHPCKAMKFAGYGHPTDKSRQSTAYSTRTFKRYLKDVSTWEINPGKHVAMQFGDCAGLIINGKDMSGYSAYLNNIYITGVIEWLEEHKDDFKGEDGKDAYSVALSSYDAVVAVNSEGKIDSSLYDVINVVSGTEMAYAGEYQITTTKYKIQTTIQAYCGEKVLQQSDVIGTGNYLVNIVPKGCEFSIAEGVITITKIMVDKATLDITINCEGMAVFTKTFTLTRVYGEKGFAGNDGKDIEFIFLRSKTPETDIPLSENTDGFVPKGWNDNPIGVTSVFIYELISRRIKINGIWGKFSTPAPWSRYASDGISPYYLNLTNDSATVPADKNGHITDYSLATTTAQLFVGQEACECTFETGIVTEGVVVVQEEAVFSITNIPNEINSAVLSISAKVKGEPVGSIVFSVSKAKTGADGRPVDIYYLSVSSDIIKRGKDGKVDINTVSVTVYKKTGNELPEINKDSYVRYKRSDDAQWVEYVTVIPVTDFTQWIEIELYNQSGGTLLDTERIPVVVDGTDGTSPYFLNLTNDSATVAADKNGHVTDYTLAATTAQLFLGQEICECSFIGRITDGANFVQDGANFQITDIPDSLDNIQLVIEAKVKGESVGSIAFNVSKAKAGKDGKTVTIHYLQLSASIVKRSNNGTVDVSFIDISAMQKTGDLAPEESTGTIIRYKRSDDENWIIGNKMIITGNTVFADVELLEANTGILLDSERVPVVFDGTNGSNGKDGAGFEIIFIRQKTDRIPDTPLSKNQDNYVPDGWTNDQQGTSSTWPYEFSCRRRKVGGIWGAFSTPAIWSRYSYDGDDAYSVALSSYEDVITLNSKGEIDSSLYDIINIVAGSELVYAGDSEVITKKYKIQTSVYAFHGAIKLEYADVATTGKYSVTITAYGCQYSVIAGVITITRITQDKASLDIVVNCEGKITVAKTYTVTRVWNGLDANLLPWIEDWDSNKNKFGDDYVISPKIFSGEKNPTTAALTGVALGRGVVTVDGVKKTGLFGIKNGKLTFELDAETGDATFRGTVYADSGKLGGIKIEGDSLTNDGFDNDAYIILRNDRTKSFAGIGGNLLPATSGGISAVARFENNRIVKGDFSPSNIAMYLEASGSQGDNIALMVAKGRMDVPGLLMGGRVTIVNNAIQMPYKYGPWKNYTISRPNDLGYIIEHNLGHSRYYVTATLCDVGSRGDMGLTGLIDVFEIRNNYFRVLVCTRDGTSVAKGFSFSIIGDNR